MLYHYTLYPGTLLSLPPARDYLISILFSNTMFNDSNIIHTNSRHQLLNTTIISQLTAG